MGWLSSLFAPKKTAGAKKPKVEKQPKGKAPHKAESEAAPAPSESDSVALQPQDMLGANGKELRLRINEHTAVEGLQVAAFILLRLSQQKNQWSSMPRKVWEQEIAKLMPNAKLEPRDVKGFLAQTIQNKWAVKNGNGFAATKMLVSLVAVPMAASAENAGFEVVTDDQEVVVIDEDETTLALT